MLEMVSAALPVFVTWMDWADDVLPTFSPPKARLVGDKVRIPVGFPVPLRFTTCGLPGALSTILMEAVRMPEAAGVKVTEMVHFPPAGWAVPQSLVWAKSPASFPDMVMLVMVNGASPLSSVMVCGALVVFTSWGAKVRPDGLSAIPAETITLEIKASQLPPGAIWAGFESGKSVEQVCPATYAAPRVSTAMPLPDSVFDPPR